MTEQKPTASELSPRSKKPSVVVGALGALMGLGLGVGTANYLDRSEGDGGMKTIGCTSHELTAGQKLDDGVAANLATLKQAHRFPLDSEVAGAAVEDAKSRLVPSVEEHRAKVGATVITCVNDVWNSKAKNGEGYLVTVGVDDYKSEK